MHQYDGSFGNTTLPKSIINKLMKLARKKCLLIGCDGSVKNGVGSFSWGVLDRDNQTAPLLSFLAPLHGDFDQSTPLRSELYGLLGALHLTNDIGSRLKHLPADSIKIYSDYQNAINPAKKHHQIAVKSIFADDADIKAEVRSLYKRVSKYASLSHVKSHQRGKCKFSNLSPAAKINTYMNDLAKSYHAPQSQGPQHDIPSYLTCMDHFKNTDQTVSFPLLDHSKMIPHLPKAWITVRHPHERITREVQATLCKYKMAHDSEKKISNTLQIQTNHVQQLEWRSFNSVVSTMKQDQRIKTMKMVHKHWPTLEREFKWKRSTTDLCPLCQEHVETREHIFRCKNPKACEHRAEELQQLKTNLDRTASHPLIVHHLYDIVEKYTRGVPICHISINLTLMMNNISRKPSI